MNITYPAHLSDLRNVVPDDVFSILYEGTIKAFPAGTMVTRWDPDVYHAKTGEHLPHLHQFVLQVDKVAYTQMGGHADGGDPSFVYIEVEISPNSHSYDY